MKGHLWNSLAVLACTASAAALAVPLGAVAQIRVGVTVSATGPAASLGIPQRNTVSLLPHEIDGEKIDYTVLDDGTDTTTAVKNMRKLIGDDHVDVVIGSSVTPASLAMVEVAGQEKVPMITLAFSNELINPPTGPRAWVFRTPQGDALAAQAVARAMVMQHVKTLGFIGYSDGFGESYLNEMKKAAEAEGVKMVDVERYARTDTAVTGQVLKLMAAHPDAVFIAGSGTPSALPERELKNRGYKGIIYQSGGAANSDFLRVCGRECDGTFMPAGPIIVAEQLPKDNPVRASALEYKQLYEAKYGAISTFGGHMWDAGQLLKAAIPVALKSGAKPGTEAFREALRDALAHVKDVAGSQGIFNMTSDNHNGMDARSIVMVEIKDGKWLYRPDL
ncbi:MAG TPA: ABC transporter substrate-binding protein [Nevskiaceae bacterium]